MKSILYALTFLFLISGLHSKSYGQDLDSSYVVINEILVAGNKVTKEHVILLEIILQTGDTININDLNKIIKKSEESLLNTSLFNYVSINTIPQRNKHISLFILVEERWYLWPNPILEHADRNLSSFLHERDWSRINYGLLLVKKNFRGRNETLRFKVRLGYKEQYQLMYSIPYLFKSKKHGLITEASYFRQNEIPYNTYNDKLVFYKDNDHYVKEYQDFALSYIYRPKHFTKHTFKAGYYHATVQDTIIKLNSYYFDESRNNTQHLSLQYQFLHDKRDFQYYPLSGYNFFGVLTQTGLGILKNKTKSISSLILIANNYHKHSKRWLSGYGTSVRISNNRKQAYFIESGLGYSNYLRAYEYYVIAGQSYFTAKTFLKYAIIPRKVSYIKALGWTKFNKVHYSLYTNAFFETGYVHDIKKPPINALPNSLLMSAGIGFDLTAYYDQVYRMEYSINKKGEHGFFLHVKKAF